MLGKVTLKCFKRHEELSVDFTQGLNVLRGANEAGKSSLLEAIMYATYGADVLTDTFAETVTWGYVDKDLKVVVEHIISGTSYTFTRSKGSASVVWTNRDGEEKKVTGHREVTAKAVEILGVEKDLAQRLMMANQSSLTAVMTGGPTAVADLINTLAGVELVDQVLERAAMELVTGSDLPLRERITTAEDTIITIQQNMPSEDMINRASEGIAALEVEILAAEAQRRAAAEAMGVADAALKDLTKANQQHLDAKAAVERATVALGAARKRRDALATSIKEIPVDVDALAAEIAVAKGINERRTLHARVTALTKGHPEVVWASEGGDAKTEFEAALGAARSAREAALLEHSTAQAAVAAQRGKYLSDGKCPTCGHSKSDPDHVAKHNEGVAAELAKLQQKLTEAAAVLAEKQGDLKSLEALQSTATRIQAAVESLEGRDPSITVDRSTYPAKILWVGAAPVEQPVAQMEATLRAARNAITENARISGEVTGQDASIVTLTQALNDASATLANAPRLDTTSATEARDAAAAEHSRVMGVGSELARRKQDMVTASATLRTKRTERLAQVTVMESELTKLRSEVAEVAYNNEFVADVRALKPAISTHLWNILLVSASTYFSKMREQQTVVTRTDKGFKANNHSVDGLSGSTKDILAIAMRVSLLQTFMPELDFIVLDEPAHGCDENRTAQILGFLASVGFTQVILASHDSLSESVAQNVVRLGE